MKPPFVDRNAVQMIFLKYFEGRKERLIEFLDDFYKSMANDVMIGFFFAGKNLHEIAIQQANFLWRAAGISESYSGKPPATAHLGLAPILYGHFDRRLRILESQLKRLGLTDDEIASWIALENAFRSAIVGH
jgi:truncated hemoglobin YjbI